MWATKTDSNENKNDNDIVQNNLWSDFSSIINNQMMIIKHKIKCLQSFKQPNLESLDKLYVLYEKERMLEGHSVGFSYYQKAFKSILSNMKNINNHIFFG